jgi:hypothetical protein
VLLSSPSDFSGGGTKFSGENEHEKCEYELHPTQGTGILFNGKVLHAALPVIFGTRQIFVTSFNFTDGGSHDDVTAKLELEELRARARKQYKANDEMELELEELRSQYKEMTGA